MLLRLSAAMLCHVFTSAFMLSLRRHCRERCYRATLDACCRVYAAAAC